MERRETLSGYAIAVVDRGFIYVGECEHNGQWCVIKDASNVRRWGTTAGLGELAQNGPTKDTVLDATGTVRVPAHALISLIDTDGALWR
jgi:hypothetical protein